MPRLAVILLPAALLWISACRSAGRDNPVDPSAPGESGELSLVLPLPKALATVVDSLVARLEGPGMVTVVKPLDFDSPLGPATLTIGAVTPGSDRKLTIEGYDLTGRLILAGERRGIAIVTGDTTRVTLDLRLTVDPGQLDVPDTSAAPGDTAVAGDSTGAEPPAQG